MMKKMANVIMLTTISRKTVPISRRMMNVITVQRWCPAGVPGRAPASSLSRCLLHYFTTSRLHAEYGVVVHAVVGLDIDVGQAGAPIEQGLGPHPGQDGRVLHDLLIDLAGVGVPRGGVVGVGHLVEQVVHHRVVELTN